MTEAVMGSDAAEATAKRAVFKDAALQISKDIALGAVPYLGQAIDAYDTIESCITLHNANTPEDKVSAEFDLILALIGWIPGPGDGVKKTFRLVERDPAKYGPVFFDLLRFVLDECGIKTSPEALLSEFLDGPRLAGEVDEIISGVKTSKTFIALPNLVQKTVVGTLAVARDEMPRFMAIVAGKVLKWKKVQRNSSAESSGSERQATHPKPNAKDATVASEGHDGASETHSNQIDKSQLAKKALSDLTNGILGVSGEHIADYICASELGWGKDWDGHDKGAEGAWGNGNPSISKMGKLSKGGFPKKNYVLYKLTDPPNGTGIDSVWRADPSTNSGKRFAIVEAKASKKEDGPKFLNKPGNTKSPSIVATLGVSGIADISQLLEPMEADESSGAGSTNEKTVKKSGKNSSSKGASEKMSSKALVEEAEGPLVQMSKEWIAQSLEISFADRVRMEIMSSYSRHLFFSPIYHPSGSPGQHAEAILEGRDESAHRTHAAFHYTEVEIKSAVNRKKKRLIKRYGNHSTLKLEA